MSNVTDPTGSGIRCAAPMSFPSSSGRTRPMAFAAPVAVGTMFSAAARDRRKSFFRNGPSITDWSLV